MVSRIQVCSLWELMLEQWPLLCAGSSGWGGWKHCAKEQECPQVSLDSSRLKCYCKRLIRMVTLAWTMQRVCFLSIFAAHSHWFQVWHWLSNLVSVTRVARRVNLLHSHPLSWLACCLLLKVGARLLYATHAHDRSPQNNHALSVWRQEMSSCTVHANNMQCAHRGPGIKSYQICTQQHFAPLSPAQIHNKSTILSNRLEWNCEFTEHQFKIQNKKHACLCLWFKITLSFNPRKQKSDIRTFIRFFFIYSFSVSPSAASSVVTYK